MIQEPAILSANTYFWTPGHAADMRRRNERKRKAEVAAYFEALGMTVTEDGDHIIGVHPNGIVASFYYSESTRNVYKTLAVRKANGANSNIIALRKLAAQVQVSGIVRHAVSGIARAQDITRQYNKFL